MHQLLLSSLLEKDVHIDVTIHNNNNKDNDTGT